MMTITELIWYLIPLVVAFVYLIFRKILYKIGFSIILFPFVLIGIEEIGEVIFRYSILPYVFFGYVLVGFFLLFYNYKADRFFTTMQFFKKYSVVIGYVSIFVWAVLIIYRLMDVFLLT
ncbi:hypothetical protein GMA11_01775 [Granulicatella sp. zg-ZJ]|uniref:hypothetical protein n=1 Tax=unclassified Granulicatella TaxID=2630493 RepID=UPI0013BF2BB3|nr:MULTISPECIES: hypothetical protein [unclassified Granulicatella]MBS4749888.1 hypothetical protein [Carnobacteriaceae bacterium zg-ZUI78]NEW62115.1 hypothetical protein [Granulicatella sp. zg-ZJ]NEW66849.1 hypothetical protein [Granulicatella sp. zg-84]